MSENVRHKPPLGLLPDWLWREHRLEEIGEAFVRYGAAGLEPPAEWRLELAEHVHWIKARKQALPDHLAWAELVMPPQAEEGPPPGGPVFAGHRALLSGKPPVDLREYAAEQLERGALSVRQMAQLMGEPPAESLEKAWEYRHRWASAKMRGGRPS